MDIALSEEQELLKASLQRFLRDNYSFAHRRKLIATEAGWSHTSWRAFADLGLLAAPLDEGAGGLGGGPIASMIIMQEFGRSLVVEPFLETVIGAAQTLEAIGSAEQKARHLPPILSGDARWALALAEPRGRFDLDCVAARAERRGDSFVLSGRKTAVSAAPWADHLIVSARTSGMTRDAHGISLFLVDRASPRLSIQSYRTIDGRQSADVTLDDVSVPLSSMIGAEGAGLAILQDCRNRLIIAQCAEAVGAMQALNTATLAYTKTRKQFGVPLGSFQVLQHRMVDMFIAQEEALSLMQHATLALASKESGLTRLASAAKSRIGDASRFVAEQAIQLQGGMGMSDELDVGHYARRITALNSQNGDPGFHLLHFAGLTRRAAPAASAA